MKIVKLDVWCLYVWYLKKLQIIERIHDINVEMYSATAWQRNNRNVNQGCGYLNLKVVFWDQESVPSSEAVDEISKPICKWYLEELFFYTESKVTGEKTE